MSDERTRDVAGILHFLTPQQMAEEIVRLDAVIAGRSPNILIGRLPPGVALPAPTKEALGAWPAYPPRHPDADDGEQEAAPLEKKE